MSWRGRRVIVTGGSGFIGSRLMRALLDAGAEAQSLDLVQGGLPLWKIPTSRLTKVDIRKRDRLNAAIRRVEPELIFHLAAQSQVGEAIADPIPTLETNVLGTWNLLEAARTSGDCGLIIASSDKAYGVSDVLPYTEEHALRSSFIYDTSKACADLLSQAFANTYGIRVMISRCGNVYGPGDLNWDRLVPHVIWSALHEKRPRLRSDGRPRRDFVFVDDIVDAYLKMGEVAHRSPTRDGTYNFGTTKPLRVLQMVRMLLRHLGRPDLMPKPGRAASQEIQDQYLSSEKARRELGWTPRTSVEDGIERSVEWYRSYLAG